LPTIASETQNLAPIRFNRNSPINENSLKLFINDCHNDIASVIALPSFEVILPSGAVIQRFFPFSRHNRNGEEMNLLTLALNCLFRIRTSRFGTAI